MSNALNPCWHNIDDKTVPLGPRAIRYISILGNFFASERTLSKSSKAFMDFEYIKVDCLIFLNKICSVLKRDFSPVIKQQILLFQT